jgi:hypothetical protein
MNECILPFQTKLGIVKFLASGVMTDSDILIHLIVAAADTRFSVANAADMQLKKIVGLVREFMWGGTWNVEPYILCYAVMLYSYIIILSWQEILNLAGEVQWFV